MRPNLWQRVHDMNRRGTSLVRKLEGRGFIAAMDDTVTPELVARAVLAGLNATYTTKHGEVPDHRTRLEAAKLALNYAVGLPVQRTIVETHEVKESDSDVMTRILASPAARDALAAILATSSEGREVAEAALKALALNESHPK